MIEVRDLWHSYGNLPALQAVGLEVARGRVVGLVGPNGAGKTTLIRAIVTLLRPARGLVRVMGHDVLRDPVRARRELGYLPERATPYADLLAWEHLDLFAAIAGHRGAERRRRVEQGLAAAGLTERRDTPARELSKGLRQRLALEAASMHDPPVLVLDEPTDGLDPDSREALLGTVRALAVRGTAVLLSTHVLAELEEVAHDVVILSRGRVVEGRAAPGPRRFRIGLRGRLAEAGAYLAPLPGVLQVKDDGEALEVALDDQKPDAADLVAALVRGGWAVTAVEPLVESLRERYRSAVAEAAR